MSKKVNKDSKFMCTVYRNKTILMVNNILSVKDIKDFYALGYSVYVDSLYEPAFAE